MFPCRSHCRRVEALAVHVEVIRDREHVREPVPPSLGDPGRWGTSPNAGAPRHTMYVCALPWGRRRGRCARRRDSMHSAMLHGVVCMRPSTTGSLLPRPKSCGSRARTGVRTRGKRRCCCSTSRDSNSARRGTTRSHAAPRGPSWNASSDCRGSGLGLWTTRSKGLRHIFWDQLTVRA